MKKLLFLIMMVLSFTSTALAATSYGFSVGGVSVTSDNYTNVTGSNITSGTVVYSPSTKTVTLTNVTITRSGSNNRAIYNETNSGLIIKFVGTNNLTTSNAVPIRCNTTTTIRVESGTTTITGSNQGGIYSDDAAITIEGSGRLLVNASGSIGIEGDGPTSGSTLTINNINMEVYGSNGALNKWKTVTCSGAQILLKATNNSSYPVASKIGSMSPTTMQYPSGAVFNSSSQAVTLNGSSVYNSSVIIGSSPMIYYNGLWYMLNGNNAGVRYRNQGEYSGSYTIASSVTLDNKSYPVTQIYTAAFRLCSSLTYVYIPSSVTTIGQSAFDKCTGLTSITIPSSVTTIGDRAFAESGLNYPSTGNGLIIPGSVTSIGNNAFLYCTNLKKVQFNSGSSAVTLGEAVFAGSGLVDAVLSNNVTTIGEDAFNSCTSLKTITIGSGCTSIGPVAFYNCPSLTKVTCNATNAPTIDNSTFNNDQYNNATLVIPDISSYVTTDWQYFKNILPTSGNKFKINGVYYNKTGSNTVEVTYGNTNYNSYYYTDSQALTIPSTVTYNGTTYTVTAIGNNAFRKSTVPNLNLPSTVTTIGQYAFYECNVNMLNLNYITSLGNYAFAKSTLQFATFGDNLTSIPQYAFYNCTSLGSVDLGSGLTSIGSYAFYNCPLTQIHCERLNTPPTLTSTTFNNYTATVTVNSPYIMSVYKAATYWKNFTNYTSNYPYDFIVNSIYYRITGTNTVEVYGYRNYYSGNIVIPATVYYSYNSTTYRVTAIGDYAFRSEHVANLNAGGTSFTAPGTTDVKSVTIGSNVTQIGNNAFEGCEGLTQITIPSGVTTIGSDAFLGCTALTSVTCNRSTPPTIQSTTFTSDQYASVTLYVPSTTAANNYKAATYWKNFYLIMPNDGSALNFALNIAGGSINFTSTGTYPWIIKGDGTRIYAQSGNAGVHSSTSTLTAQITVTKASIVSFDFKAWGEGTSYDKCVFSVDGTTKFSYGERQNDWETYEVEVPAGTHTLKWEYSKDGSAHPAGDYFAIDNVKILSNIPKAMWVDDVVATPGQTITVPVYMSTNENVIGSLLTLVHPSGFNITEVLPGEILNADDAIISFNNGSNNSVVQILGRNDATIVNVDRQGVLCYMAIQVPEDASGQNEFSSYVEGVGSYAILQCEQSGVVQLPVVTFNVNVNTGNVGDVNGDGKLSIGDVTDLINFLLSGETPPAAADVNGDGKVSIGDVTELINMLLSGTNNHAINARGFSTDLDGMQIGGMNIANMDINEIVTLIDQMISGK